MKSAPSHRRFFDKRRGRARFGAARAFTRANRGAVAAFSAASVGLLTIMLAAMLDYAALLSARRSAQGAMDRATISAARAVVAAGQTRASALNTGAGQGGGAPYASAAASGAGAAVTVIAGRDSDSDDSDSQPRNSRYDDDETNDSGAPNFDAIAQDAGAPQFEAEIATERLEATQVRFEHVGDLVLGRAELAYEPYILDALGYDAFDMTVSADARLSLSQTRSAPACFSALNGNVSGDGVLHAPACGIAATGQISSDFAQNTALICENSECDHGDPYTTLSGQWFTNTGAGLTCSSVLMIQGRDSMTISGPARFCDLVTIQANQTLHLMGGVFYFEGGLVVMSGGRVDSTGNGGSVIVLKQGATLDVQDGAIFTIMPSMAGMFAGLSLVGGGVSGVSQASIVSTATVRLEGIIYLPGYRFVLDGPVGGGGGASPLAIWADSITLSALSSLSGTPAANLPIISVGGDAGAIVLAR